MRFRTSLKPLSSLVGFFLGFKVCDKAFQACGYVGRFVKVTL